jgi:DNA-binding NarL/FixJ family response regulator
MLESRSAAPAISGLEVLGRLQSLSVPVRCIVLTASRESDQVDSAYLRGVYAYLYKLDASGEQLATVVRAVHRGERLGHPRSLELAWQAPPAAPGPVVSAIGALTPREREVLAWIGTGADNLKISAQLGISERTVSAHVSSIYRKLGRENRTELALLARDAGLRIR